MSNEDLWRGFAANKWSPEPRSDRYNKQNIVLVLPPGTRDMIQCCWPDGKQRTSYFSFPRAYRWWLVGKRRTKSGREWAKNCKDEVGCQ
jgi:hypothetical protein